MNMADGGDMLRSVPPAAAFALLASDTVGRVVYSEGALPAVTVVNYAVDGQVVIFRTRADSRLANGTRGTVVAFEADGIDRANRTGWSVVVVGVATPVTDRGGLVRASALGIAPWPGAGRDRFVRITPGVVTAREVGAGS